MQVVKLSLNDTKDLESFCYQCKLIGYNNNATLQDLKWAAKYDLPSMAQYWAIYKDNQIVSIAGCHQFESNTGTLRCLFRAATLPEYTNLVKGISRNHMNSASFSIILPEQLKYGLENGFKEFVITTTPYSDASGRMHKTHRAMELISQNNIVEYLGDKEYFYVRQSIWKINLSKYFEALIKFKQNNSYE